jgi:hypothetical protein
MKDGVRARYTLEFKQEVVRLVRSGETLASSRGRRSSLGRSGQGSDRRTDGDFAAEGGAVAGAHGARQLKKRRRTSRGSRGEVRLYRATSRYLAYRSPVPRLAG